MSVHDAARLFVRLKLPYFAAPRGARRVAARIARDFVTFIEAFTRRFNELHSTQLSPAEALVQLLNSGTRPRQMFAEYGLLAQQSRGALSTWTQQKGYEKGAEFLTPEFATWFVHHVLDKPCRIDEYDTFDGAVWLKKILLETEGGMKWMFEFIDELRAFLYPGAPPLEERSNVGVSAEQ